ncbi:hypothetical protein N0V90_004543 [Kalmusia sp. IMI 367209]|nr:hypothetical protein N0V90_004543 [Kalmusia sp. IMI 367209]
MPYRFSGTEKRQYNAFSSAFEKAAYLRYAIKYQAARPIVQFPKNNFKIMRAPKEKALISAETPDEDKEPIDVEVEYTDSSDEPGDGTKHVDIAHGFRGPESGPQPAGEDKTAEGRWVEGSKDVIGSKEVPEDRWENANPLDYRFAKTLLKREAAGWGAGAATMIRLYVGCDIEGNVRDRVVVKVVDYPAWGAERLIQLLHEKHEILDSLPDSKYILKDRCWWRNVRRQYGQKREGIRSYSDYCAAGDLWSVLKEYSNKPGGGAMKVPEFFLWHVFRCIGEALYSMETGLEYRDDAEDDDEEPGWVKLIHRDIKPHNIFLRAPADPAQYPTPVLADFDITDKLTEKTTRPTDTGTPGYISPENLGNNNVQVTTRSDVWGLGSVIWDLMHSDRGVDNDINSDAQGLMSLRRELEENFRRKVWDVSEDVSLFEQIDIVRADGQRYTSWLADVVHACTHIRPEKRPDALNLVREVQKMEDNLRMMLGDDLMELIPRESDRVRYSDQFPLSRKLNIRRRKKSVEIEIGEVYY